MSLGKNIGMGVLALGLGFSSLAAVQQPTAQARIRIHNYKQAERAVAHKHGHYFHGRYYIWTVMGSYRGNGHVRYLMRHRGHWVYWVRGMDYYGQKHRGAGTYWGHDYYVYLNGHVSGRF